MIVLGRHFRALHNLSQHYGARHRRVVQPIDQRLPSSRRQLMSFAGGVQERVHVLRVVKRVVRADKCRPRHEARDERHLRGFQLIRIKKAADARQVRHELGVVRLPAKSHRIESIDEVTALLKLCRLEEELRDVYPVALRRISCAVVDGAGPAGKSAWIGFAAQEIYVLLTHEEVGVIDRIRAIRGVVIDDRHGCGGLRPQSRAAGTVQTDSESFVTFGVSVIDDGDREVFDVASPAAQVMVPMVFS